MPRFKDQAICIRHLDWAETSQIVVLMTEQHGKVRGIAKGSKRTSPSSIQRFSGGIDLLTRGEILGIIRPSSELATLTEWDLQDDYHHLRISLRDQRLAMYAADLVHALFADHDVHPRAFFALRQLLESLRDSDESARQFALLRFQWELLDDAGYRPELEQDVHTGEPLPALPTYNFDPQGGGLTQRNGLTDWRVRPGTVELLRKLSGGTGSGETDVASGDSGDSGGDSTQRANRLLCAYIRAILDQQLPTMTFVLGSPSGHR